MVKALQDMGVVQNPRQWLAKVASGTVKRDTFQNTLVKFSDQVGVASTTQVNGLCDVSGYVNAPADNYSDNYYGLNVERTATKPSHQLRALRTEASSPVLAY